MEKQMQGVARPSKQYTGQPQETLAFFVGGPENGMTRFLPREVTEYRTITQNTLEYLRNSINDSVDFRLVGMKTHIYKRTKMMSAPYYHDCWIFEWMEESF